MPTGLAASSSFLATTPKDFAASWAFVLEPLDGGRTRFVERFRVRFGDAGPSFRVIRPVMGFGVFLMLQRQMLGLKARAERTVVVTPARCHSGAGSCKWRETATSRPRCTRTRSSRHRVG